MEEKFRSQTFFRMRYFANTIASIIVATFFVLFTFEIACTDLVKLTFLRVEFILKLSLTSMDRATSSFDELRGKDCSDRETSVSSGTGIDEFFGCTCTDL